MAQKSDSSLKRMCAHCHGPLAYGSMAKPVQTTSLTYAAHASTPLNPETLLQPLSKPLPLLQNHTSAGSSQCRELGPHASAYSANSGSRTPQVLALLLQIKPVHEVVQVAERAAVAGGGRRPRVDAGAGLMDDAVDDLNAALVQARLRHVHIRRIDLVQVQVLREVLLEPRVRLSPAVACQSIAM